MTDTTADDTNEQREVRLAKRARLLERGEQAYPVSVPVTDAIGAVRERYADLGTDTTTGDTVGLAGRVVHLRNTGKLCFAALQAGDGSRIQAMVSLDTVGEESLADWKAVVDLGDQLFVSGEVITSRRGELSILVDEWRIAAKALLPLPNLHTELSEETRVRSRYLDLIARPDARSMVLKRAAAVASMRSTFASHGFIELETPMLQTQQGGASATPFRTRSKAYDTDLFLRIAPELFLKRAAVGGLERIFEINRNFRDENPDHTHSPEFAMLEAYQAYSDYSGIADLTQELVQNAAIAAGGSTVVSWFDGTEFDLGGEWDRVSMYPSLSAASGIEITPETPLDELVALTERLEIEVPHPIRGKYVEELWEHFVKPSLERPDLRDGLPRRHLPARARPPHDPRGRGEVGSLRPRIRAGDGLLGAGGPGRAAAALRRAGRARRRGRPRGDADRRGLPPRPRVRHAADRRDGHGGRPPADGPDGRGHPRDDPVPPRQVGAPRPEGDVPWSMWDWDRSAAGTRACGRSCPPSACPWCSGS